MLLGKMLIHMQFYKKTGEYRDHSANVKDRLGQVGNRTGRQTGATEVFDY